MELNTLKPEMRTNTTSGKVLIVQRFLEHQRAERLRVMRRFLEPLAEQRRRVFIVPRRRTLWVPPRVPSVAEVLAEKYGRMPSNMKRLAEFLERLEPDPRVERFIEVTEALKQGDDEALRRFVLEEVGARDHLTVVLFKQLLDRARHHVEGERVWTVEDVYDEFLPHQRKRLQDKEYTAHEEDLYREARRKISMTDKKGNPNRVATTLEHHRTEKQSHEQALRELLLGGLYEGWTNGVPRDKLGPNAANILSRKGTGRDDQNVPGLLASLDAMTEPRNGTDEKRDPFGEAVEDLIAPAREERNMRIVREVLYGDDPLLSGFTERDLLILRAKHEGRPDEEVAAELDISPANVRKIRSRVYGKVRDLA